MNHQRYMYNVLKKISKKIFRQDKSINVILPLMILSLEEVKGPLFAKVFE